MQNYLTLDETIEKLKNTKDKNLTNLVVQGVLTPVFHYIGYVVVIADTQAIASDYGIRLLKPRLSNDLIDLLENRRESLELSWEESSPKVLSGVFDSEILELFGYQPTGFLLYEYDLEEFSPISFPLDIEALTYYHPTNYKFNLQRSMVLINEHELNMYLDQANSKTEFKRGVSQAKLNAKLAACTLAEYLWKQDTEKNIRIKDMAISVRFELSKTEHADQLPEKAESLENWIKDVADKYPHSRQAGRPKNR